MPTPHAPTPSHVEALARELERYARWFVLTGAGVSTESGIPAYRDESGAWRHKKPIAYGDFVGDQAVRRRYWARSFVGFERVAGALPSGAHRAIAQFQALGRAPVLVTQNVDGLHQKAGSSEVIDLHGQLANVRCLSCGALTPRAELQSRLLADNPQLGAISSTSITPDGDAEIDDETCRSFVVPSCSCCDGMLKPDVVFFGEAVPEQRRTASYEALEAADAMLVVGSSLQVFSGHRFVKRAVARGKPIVVVNRGVTRADPMAQSKFDGPCGALLEGALAFFQASDQDELGHAAAAAPFHRI